MEIPVEFVIRYKIKHFLISLFGLKQLTQIKDQSGTHSAVRQYR